MLTLVLLVVFAYLAGSLGSAVLISRLLGLPDPRRHGSGNPGTTNVLRLGGRGAALAVLAGDFFKGTLPVVIARLAEASPLGLALVGVAAFLGHLYPVFFGFKGGKGVATGLGVLLGWDWVVVLATALTWLALALTTRYSSLAALVAFALAPAYLWWATASAALTAGAVAMTLALYWRHRGNIHRLAAGTESRIRLRS